MVSDWTCAVLVSCCLLLLISIIIQLSFVCLSVFVFVTYFLACSVDFVPRSCYTGALSFLELGQRIDDAVL